MTSYPPTKTDPFKQFQTTYRSIIDAQLTSWITDVSDPRKKIVEAAHHSLQAGGKRIRPLLSILSTQLLGKKPELIFPFASAIEYIHTYSLIHDDLPAMDNDDFRRGQPTCHIKFGEDIAILAGDLLQTLAFDILSQPMQNITPDSQLECIQYVSKSIGNAGMIGGQVLDISHTASISDIHSLQHIHDLKTGALIEISLLGPAILFKATADIKTQLSSFGKKLGLLFQITDDILDETGSKEELGKNPGKDQSQNKLTYTTLLGLERAKEMAQQEAKEAKLILNSFQSETTTILSSLVEYLLIRTH